MTIKKRYWFFSIPVLMAILAIGMVYQPTEKQTQNIMVIPEPVIPHSKIEVEESLQTPRPVTPQTNTVSQSANEMLPALAPRSDTYEEYLEDLDSLAETHAPNTEHIIEQEEQHEEILVRRQLNISLWRPNPDAKSAFENFDESNELSSEHFIDFDETALENLEIGDKFELSLMENESIQTLVTDVENFKNKAKNWKLSDLSGRDMGSLTQTQDMVEGIFISSTGQEYHIRALGGVGWIASKADLIRNITPKFTRNLEDID